MARNRFGLGCILVPIGLLVVLVAGTWLFMKFLASALHPDPQAIPSVTRREPSPQWSEAVNRARRSIRASLAEQNLPGLSVAVGVGGSMVWTEGFGWAHIETRMPITPDTRFRIGTASTVLTSAAVGVLLEKGRLRLDDEIQTYVPQFPKKQWSVRLRQLMAHVGGWGPMAETRGHCSLTAASGPWKRWSTSHRMNCCLSRGRNTGIRSMAGYW